MSEMNVPLVKSLVPDSTDETPANDGKPVRISGDYHDDDGRYIDDILEPMDPGPIDYSGVVPEVNKVPSTNRVIGGSKQFNGGTQNSPAVRLLPPDPNRIKCVLTMANDVANNVPSWLLVSDSAFTVPPAGTYIGSLTLPPLAADGPGAIFVPAAPGFAYESGIVVDLGAFTGALYVGMWGAWDDQPLYMSYLAVTG